VSEHRPQNCLCGCGHSVGDHGARSGLCGVEGCQCEGVHGPTADPALRWLFAERDPVDVARGVREEAARALAAGTLPPGYGPSPEPDHA
jgi:hypothetical protein